MKLPRIILTAILFTMTLGEKREALAQSMFEGPCKAIADQITEEINAARECKVDQDCVLEFFGCPFGCGSIVSKDRVSALKKKIVDDFEGTGCMTCKYNCAIPKGPIVPVCELGLCEVKR